jgi:chromate transporter
MTSVAHPVTAAKGSSAALREVTLLALKLGFTAFGGPAAHIAMLRHEVVTRREWVSDAYFVDLIGATNLIPGPNSTEMVMHVGHVRAGNRGMIAAGLAFILPAAAMVLLLAWIYMRYATTPELDDILYGIKPVIIAVVVHAVAGLLRTAVKTWFLAALGVLVFAAYLAGLNELALLFGAGLVALAWNRIDAMRRGPVLGVAPVVLLPFAGLLAPANPATGKSADLWQLFLSFLKIGSVLYGSGYVLLAFLRNEVVEGHGWLTNQQLLDAVAIGQFTPGPVFTTATFVGYVAAGFPGAVLATVGIFLPAFVFVAILHPLVPKIRTSAWASALLDGLNVAALGLMAAVSWELGQDAVVDWLTVAIAIASFVALYRYRVNSAWLVLAGGALGFVAMQV